MNFMTPYLQRCSLVTFLFSLADIHLRCLWGFLVGFQVADFLYRLPVVIQVEPELHPAPADLSGMGFVLFYYFRVFLGCRRLAPCRSGD
jgi:hypothetical protein